MNHPIKPVKNEQPTRRDFLKSSAAAASVAALGSLAIERSAHAAGSDIIKIGMIGAGGRCSGAAANAMSVDKGVKLVAMCDLFMDRVKSKRESLKKAKPEQVDVDDARCFDGFDGYKHVIENSDVVLIANAAKFHPYYTLAAIQAGKHVFCEKPHGIDPLGIKVLKQAVELAKEKKLCIVSGLQSRFHKGYIETMKRIHDGAIGEIVSIEENFLRAPYNVIPRKPELSEVQWQCSTQYHFTWLSGDDVPQSLVHNVDRATWAMKEQMPVKCHGIGGRSSSFDGIYGSVFDHHSVIYQYANGVRMYAFCRTQNKCYSESSSIILGSKGRANLTGCHIDGENKWHFDGPHGNPYDDEHTALFGAIRSGTPINCGDYMARSTLATIMGQISCYTGNEVTWDQVEKSDFCYAPKPEECSFTMEPPVKPGPDGVYPVPVPGQTKLI